jgi:hypothetical protein
VTQFGDSEKLDVYFSESFADQERAEGMFKIFNDSSWVVSESTLERPLEELSIVTSLYTRS